MKKLLFALLFFTYACDTNHVSNISDRVKSVDDCFENATTVKKTGTAVKEVKSESDNNISSVLPAFFWDTKSMIR